MQEKPDFSRRGIVKLAGSLGAISISPSVVSAQDGTSVVEAGISEEVNALVSNGEMDEVFELLDKNNVKYNKTTETLAPEEPTTQPQDYYETNNSSATFYTSVWDEDKDHYAIGISWGVSSDFQDIDTPGPSDIATLSFEQDIFGYVDDSITTSGSLTWGDVTEDGLTEVVSEPGSAKANAPSNGAVAKFNDGLRNTDLDGDGINDYFQEGTGVTQIVVRKQNTSTKGIVSGLFTHNWTALNINNIDVLKNVSISVAGLISVSVPTGVDKWSLPGPDNRDDEL